MTSLPSSWLQIKTLEIKGFRAQRLPKVNLVAQYSLFAKYNNFQNYFQKFSRNNVELGASFEIPVLAGRAGAAYAEQSEAEAAKIHSIFLADALPASGTPEPSFEPVTLLSALAPLPERIGLIA